jgi:hypothetical protein
MVNFLFTGSNVIFNYAMKSSYVLLNCGGFAEMIKRYTQQYIYKLSNWNLLEVMMEFSPMVIYKSQEN